MRNNKNGSAGPWIVLLLLVVLWVGGIIGAVIRDYQIEKDTISWLDRAQVASDISDMREYLTNCENGMKKWHVDEGHAALIFKKPDNDLTLIMEALNNTIMRCYELEAANVTTVSIEYQTALDDMRGQIRELDLNMTYGWWINYGKIWAVWVYVGWFPCLIAFAWADW